MRTLWLWPCTSRFAPRLSITLYIDENSPVTVVQTQICWTLNQHQEPKPPYVSQNVSPSKTMEWNCSSKCLNRLTKVGNHLRKHITHDIIVVSKTKTIFRKTYYENIETKLSNSKNSFRNFLLSRKILWRCRANSKMRKLPIHQPVSRKAIQSVQWKNALENKIKMVEYGFVKYN